MKMTERRIHGTCQIDGGPRRCKYLGHHPDHGHVCMKLGPEFRGARVRVEKLAASGKLEARGDNCDGVLR